MEKTTKFTTILLWVLMSISVLMFVVMMASIDSETNPGETAISRITLNMNWSIFLLVAATLAAIFFSVIQVFGDKKAAVSMLVTLVGMVAILGVSYLMASSDIPATAGTKKMVADGDLTESISKWVGTGLFYTYIMFAAAILSTVGFSVASVFKR